jgi:hypothetical protein
MLPFPKTRVRILAFALLLIPGAAKAQTPAAPSPSPWPYEDISIPDLPAARPPAPGDAPRSPEPPSAAFGARGQVVIGGGTNIGVSQTTYDSSGASQLSYAFNPSVHYFVLKNFSIGLNLDLGYSDNRGYGADGSLVETKTTSFSGGPVFGWNIPLSPAVSWWLMGTLGIESNHTETSLVSGSSISTASSAGAATTSQDGPWVSLYVPLLLHPAPHFFMGAGPSVFHEFAALQGGPNVGDQRTTFGGSFLVGGYWGGSPEPASTPATDSATKPARRFGERGEVVFTNELVANVYSTAYAGTSSSDTQGSFTFGMDYFFTDHVAAGFSGNGGWNNFSGLDTNGNAVTYNTTSYGVAARLGVEIPLGSLLSLYPRASLGAEFGNDDEKSSAGEDSYSFSEVWIGAYVPLLVHVAPHFFVGFGPSISRDLATTITFAQGQQTSNNATTLGAGFVVGGWL